MNGWHPNQELLVEFAAGSASIAQSLCVAVHIHFCRDCSVYLEKLNVLGAQIWEEGPPVKVTEDCKTRVMARLDAEISADQDAEGQEAETADIPPNLTESSADAPMEAINAEASNADQIEEISNVRRIKGAQVPKALKRLIPKQFDDLKWEVLLSTLSVAPLTESQGYKIALYKIKAGGRVTPHTHRGDEFIVILQGSFSDCYGHYQEGDFIHCDERHDHSPVASQDQDCLCLTALKGPVQLTQWWWRWLNPFLRMP